MRHLLRGFEGDASTSEVEYGWRVLASGRACECVARELLAPLEAGSHEEFITEHYWGYCRQRDGGTVEYRVAHPTWRIYDVAEATLDCDIAAFYGSQFAKPLAAAPVSAFVADGSPIEVHKPARLRFDD